MQAADQDVAQELASVQGKIHANVILNCIYNTIDQMVVKSARSACRKLSQRESLNKPNPDPDQKRDA